MSRQGFTIVETLASLFIMSLVLMGMMGVFSTAFKSQRHTELTGDLEAIRTLLRSSIDCTETFKSAGINPVSPGSSCTSSSADSGQLAPYIRLRRKTTDGSVQWLGSDWNGTEATLGTWKIRASCSANEQSLVVRAGRPDGKGSFLADPLTRRPATWSDTRSLLFGGGSEAIPLCFNPPSSSSSEVTVDNTGGSTIQIACTYSGLWPNLIWTKLILNKAVSDPSNIYDPILGKFTPPAGTWMVNASVSFRDEFNCGGTGAGCNSFPNSRLQLAIYKNGQLLRPGAVARNYYYGQGASISYGIIASGSDTFEIYASYHNCTGPASLSTNPKELWVQFLKVSSN